MVRRAERGPCFVIPVRLAPEVGLQQRLARHRLGQGAAELGAAQHLRDRGVARKGGRVDRQEADPAVRPRRPQPLLPPPLLHAQRLQRRQVEGQVDLPPLQGGDGVVGPDEADLADRRPGPPVMLVGRQDDGVLVGARLAERAAADRVAGELLLLLEGRRRQHLEGHQGQRLEIALGEPQRDRVLVAPDHRLQQFAVGGRASDPAARVLLLEPPDRVLHVAGGQRFAVGPARVGRQAEEPALRH